MDIVIGSVVRAKAGRDKCAYFVVTDITSDGFCLICDGKRRKMEKPKRKNIKHLEATSTVTRDIKTNRQIRQTLREFTILGG